MLVIGVAGTELTAQERDWLQHDAVAGVILFKRNFASRDQVADLSAAIRAAAPRPQLVCVDQEGGRVQRFRDGMLRTARQGSYEQIVTLMFGAEWMYYFWCRRASEHRQSDADVRRWVEMHAEDEFYQQALWLKNELDRCAMALSESEKQALSALYGDVLQWEIDFHHAAYEA